MAQCPLVTTGGRSSVSLIDEWQSLHLKFCAYSSKLHAETYYFLVSQVNPGLVNLLVSRVREELAKEKAAPEKRPSVLEKIQKNKTAIQAKTAEKKLLGQER